MIFICLFELNVLPLKSNHFSWKWFLKITHKHFSNSKKTFFTKNKMKKRKSWFKFLNFQISIFYYSNTLFWIWFLDFNFFSLKIFNIFLFLSSMQQKSIQESENLNILLFFIFNSNWCHWNLIYFLIFFFWSLFFNLLFFFFFFFKPHPDNVKNEEKRQQKGEIQVH